MIKYLIIFLLLLTANCFAAVNGTTPTALTLLSTFEAISVWSPFTGDENNNNSATVQFKADGSETWLESYTPWIDRRILIAPSGNPNPQSNNCVVSIVGLAPDTLYSVKINWFDADGITGAASITNTIRTKTYAPPTGGSTLYVDGTAVSEGVGSEGDPYKTITNALFLANPGDTILAKNSAYTFFTWTKSGTPSAYVIVRNYPGHSPSLIGGTNRQNVDIQADNIVLDGFRFETSTNSGAIINGRTNVYVQNCRVLDLCNDADGLDIGGRAASGFLISATSTNVFLLTNIVNTTKDTRTGELTMYGVYLDANLEGIYVQSCTTTNLRDGIGTGNSWTHGIARNGDIKNCTFTDYYDDSVELEGMFSNVRFWNNTINASNSASLLGMAGVNIGPAYIFRNDFGGTHTGSAVGFKNGHTVGSGKYYVFHNIINNRAYVGNSSEAVSGGSNIVYRNNIILAGGNAFYNITNGIDLDYNIYTNKPGIYFIDSWQLNGANVYSTLAEWQAASGMDANSYYAVPQFDTDGLHLLSSSPGVNTGLVLPNFNSVDSAWPYSGNGPEIGLYENYFLAQGKTRPGGRGKKK
jgi:hypothetical protein